MKCMTLELYLCKPLMFTDVPPQLWGQRKYHGQFKVSEDFFCFKFGASGENVELRDKSTRFSV